MPHRRHPSREEFRDSDQFSGERPSRMPRIYHVGVHGGRSGGISTVIDEYVSWPLAHVESRVISTTRRAHDPLSALLLMRALLVIGFGSVLRPDRVLVVAHLSQGGSFAREGLVLLWCRFLRARTVAYLHGSNFVAFSERRTAIVRTVLRSADQIYVLTTPARARLATMGIGSATSVFLVRNPVPRYLGERGLVRRQAVVFGGEVGTRKGVDVLLEAWAMLGADLRGSWELQICGPLSGEIGADRMSGIASYLGEVSRAELGRLLEEGSIAVLPSRHEALPMFLIEAMAHGLPVISTCVGEVDSLVAADCGILVDPGDARALHNALFQLMGDGQSRLTMGARGQNAAFSQFSAEAVANEFADRVSLLLGVKVTVSA